MCPCSARPQHGSAAAQWAIDKLKNSRTFANCKEMGGGLEEVVRPRSHLHQLGPRPGVRTDQAIPRLPDPRTSLKKHSETVSDSPDAAMACKSHRGDKPSHDKTQRYLHEILPRHARLFMTWAAQCRAAQCRKPLPTPRFFVRPKPIPSSASDSATSTARPFTPQTSRTLPIATI